MARSKPQLTHAKRDRERARLEKRARKQAKKEARKLGTLEPGADASYPHEDAHRVESAEETHDQAGLPSG